MAGKALLCALATLKPVIKLASKSSAEINNQKSIRKCFSLN